MAEEMALKKPRYNIHFVAWECQHAALCEVFTHRTVPSCRFRQMYRCMGFIVEPFDCWDTLNVVGYYQLCTELPWLHVGIVLWPRMHQWDISAGVSRKWCPLSYNGDFTIHIQNFFF